MKFMRPIDPLPEYIDPRLDDAIVTNIILVSNKVLDKLLSLAAIKQDIKERTDQFKHNRKMQLASLKRKREDPQKETEEEKRQKIDIILRKQREHLERKRAATINDIGPSELDSTFPGNTAVIT